MKIVVAVNYVKIVNTTQKKPLCHIAMIIKIIDDYEKRCNIWRE